jgi:hypothetical protein
VWYVSAVHSSNSTDSVSTADVQRRRAAVVASLLDISVDAAQLLLNARKPGVPWELVRMSAQETWETLAARGLIPESWLDDPHRRFRYLRALTHDGLTECVEPYPAYSKLCVAFAADVERLVTAEAKGRNVAHNMLRLVPIGNLRAPSDPPCEVVVWDIAVLQMRPRSYVAGTWRVHVRGFEHELSDSTTLPDAERKLVQQTKRLLTELHTCGYGVTAVWAGSVNMVLLDPL